MTPAEPPTECATPRPRERVLGPNRHTCKEVNEKDARIRELVGALGKVIHLAEDQHERVRLFQQQIGEDLLPHNPQCAVEPGLAEARAALARSEGGGA